MERTYVFNDGGNGGGSKLDVTAMLPGLFGNRGLDPNLLAVMNGGNGFGGRNGIWEIIALVIVSQIFGFGNYGGYGGRFGGGIPAALAGNEGREMIVNLLQGNANSISQLAQSLNCSTQQVQTALCNIQNSVGLTGTQIINAIQSGNNSVLNQLSSCCCNMLQAVERQGYESRLATCEQTHTLVDTANNNARDLQAAIQAQTQAIMAKLDAAETRVLQDKLDAERQKSATLAAQLSNEHQTQAIMASVAQQNAPIVAALQALQSDVEKVKCSLPPTISVPYPTVTAVNTDLYRAAAYGAAAGSYAGGYGCNGYWG